MKAIIDTARRTSQKSIFSNRISDNLGWIDVIKIQHNKNKQRKDMSLSLSIQNFTQTKRCFFLYKSNSFMFSSNNKLPDQEGKNNEQSKNMKNSNELEEKLQRMIFSPKILLANLQHIIENQLIQSMNQQSQQKDSHDHIDTNTQTKQNPHILQKNTNILQNTNLLRKCYILRNFMQSVLQLDKQIAVMNEVDHDEDYKLDTTFKIIQQIYSLHKMIQSSIQAILKQKQRQQGQGQISQSNYQKLVLLQWCQIVNLIKLLQLAPNDKSFNFIKFLFYFKTWKQRFQYFRQGLPLGVHIRFFGKAVKFSQQILNNIVKIQSIKKVGNKNKNKDYQNYEIEMVIETLLNMTYQQFIDSQKIDIQNQQQRLNKYINTYKTQLDQYHRQKSKSKSIQNPLPPPTKRQKFFFEYSQEKREFTKDKEFIIQQRQRRIEVNFQFVQICVLTMLSRQMEHQHKIDRLNDYRNAVHRQYETYSQLKQSGKLQTFNYQEQTKRYYADRRNKNKFLQQYVRFDKLIAKNFMEYMRANIVGTWTIYRAEDLVKHQYFKKDKDSNKK